MAEVFSWRDAPPGDYAVVGDPIAHSKSPSMHHAAYRALGLDLTYRAIQVPVGEVAEALDHLRDLGYRGVNVTVPHKEAALAWASETDVSAREAGAANTLNLQTGAATNTDGHGYRLSNLSLSGKPRRVLLLGAGGSAATVLLATLGKSELAIWNRNPERAHRLVREIGERLEPPSEEAIVRRREHRGGDVPATAGEHLARRKAHLARVRVLETPDLANFNLIVNATPASLRGEDLGLDWTQAEPEATAYDLAYGVDDAPFLRGAREAGLRTLDGRDMLAHQGSMALIWWGVAQLDPASVAAGEPRPYRYPDESGPRIVSAHDFTVIMRRALD